MTSRQEEFVRCVANNELRLILMPTEACNFRCTYCYEDFRYKRMDDSVVTGVKRFLGLRAPHLSQLEISWFGGEPMLATSVIVAISNHVQELLRSYPKIRYNADMTTNAYLLTRRRFEQLLELGVSRYQIAFDGPREVHDRKRVHAGGGRTFDRIWGNLLAMREMARDFHVTVRLHVDRENFRALPRFIREYAREFRQDERFELFIRRLSQLGGPNDAEMTVFDGDSATKALSILRRYADRLGVPQTTTDKRGPVCYAVRANSYVVRANGRLNKCTVALEHPNNQLGRIRENGFIEIDHSKLRMWMRGLDSGKDQELTCPMIGYADPSSVPNPGQVLVRS